MTPRIVAHACSGDGPATAAAAPIRILPASIPQNVAWTASGSVAYALCQWGTLVAFARLGTPEALGQFAFALAISAPIMMFLQLQLRTVQVTDTEERFEFADYLALRLIASLLGLGAVLAVAAAAGHGESAIAVAGLVAGVKVLDGIGDVFSGAWQKLERLDVPAGLLILNGVVSLGALTVALWVGASVAVAVAGSLAGSIVALAASVWLSRRHLRDALRPSPGTLHRMRALFVLALPLGFVMALISLTSNIPRYFIQLSFGERELGIFAALIYVTAAGTTMVSAVGNSLTPGMAREFDRGNLAAFTRRVWALVSVAAAIGAGSVLVAVLFARPLLELAYGPAYAAAAPAFVRAMVLGTITYMAAAVGFAMSAAKCFRAQAPLFAIVVGGVLAASAAWIPSGGLNAAVSALMVGASLQLALGAAVVFRAVRSARATFAPCGASAGEGRVTPW